MTQYIQFIPSSTKAPSFEVILDRVLCQVIITWNVSAQRYYINIYLNDGSLALAVPLVESSQGIDLTSLIWDQHQRVMIGTFSSLIDGPRPFGQIVQFTLQDCDPDSLNTTYNCMMLSHDTFSFPMATDPSPINKLGSVHRYLNMIAPWFTTSTMIFRDMQFEVRP